MTNTAGEAEDVLFQRDVGWSTLNVFAEPILGNVVGSSYAGTVDPDPTVPYPFSCAAGCDADNDVLVMGGGIRLDLGTLLPGQSALFNFYYGVSQIGETANGLDDQLNSLGAIYYVTGQSDENGIYPNLGIDSTVIGVGRETVTPEPSSFIFLGSGLLAILGVSAVRGKSKAQPNSAHGSPSTRK